MSRLKVLTEGAADVPTVREVLTRRFGLVELKDFEVFFHQGKGDLPKDLLGAPPPHRRGLLDQLPAKLRGFSHLGRDSCVLVLVDADDEACDLLLGRLNDMLDRLPKRPPCVLFRIAIEETESWFIADHDAIRSAYPKAAVSRLRQIPPDAVVGAWQALAKALGVQANQVTGATKEDWARRIAPHLNLHDPRSPSLAKFIEGIHRWLTAKSATPRVDAAPSS